MYKVMYDMFFKGRVISSMDRFVYPNTYTEISGAQRMLRRAFKITASNRETPPTPIEGYKVVRSYYKPHDISPEMMEAVRVYIVEEDS